MSDHDFELARDIERYLAALSKLYAQNGERHLQEIIVNASIRVQGGCDRDNWNGGTYGHALFLTLPEPIYLKLVAKKGDIQDKIKDDINKIHNVQNEYISEVFFEFETLDDHDWRATSGLLLKSKRTVSIETEKRIWEDKCYRVFLSHKAEVKKDTSDLKQRLRAFGISAFVAHEDITPTREWQGEIESALASMDAFVALMTANFHESDWTDQEIGYAFGVAVPIVCVKLGKDPYGFIGKFQALSCSWDTAAKQLLNLLIKNERMVDAYIYAVENCRNFNEANVLAEALPLISKMSEDQVQRLVAAYEDNSEVGGSFGFNGSKASQYGPGLESHLSRIMGRPFNLAVRGVRFA